MSEFTRLLIEEPPLQVLPSLTAILDINKAVILQQIQYWINSSQHEIDGHKWIYNSYSEWEPQFPWLKARTIQYHILGLEKLGYLVAGNFNKDRRDKTKWYRIDYDVLDRELATNLNSGRARYSQPLSVSCMASSATDYQPLPETTTETTTRDTKKEYGEFSNVRFTDAEHSKLKERFGSRVPEMIEKLSAYKKSKNKRYASDYATTLNWARRDNIPVANGQARGVIIMRQGDV